MHKAIRTTALKLGKPRTLTNHVSPLVTLQKRSRFEEATKPELEHVQIGGYDCGRDS